MENKEEIKNDLIGILEYSKIIIRRFQDCEGISVDMTLGKGNDSLYLSKYFKKVISFDIQKEAIEESKKRLREVKNIEKIEDSHEKINYYINEKVSLGIYNLGYLPGYDESITTNYKSTLNSLDKLLDLLKIRGVVIIVVYPGHKEGKIESIELEKYTLKLDKTRYNVSKYQMLNKETAPYVLSIFKKKE